jgi:LuxR family transcriptional regulator, maltose regulon positive regulatory protein
MLHRPRVLALIDDGIQRPLTLISAPAGSGKTTLLTQWIAGAEASAPIAWLRLGREDADRRRFWVDVVHTLAGVNSELAMLAPPRDDTLEPFLTRLLNTIAGFDEPLVLVLDDLQVVSPAVIADLDWFLENAPDGVRLVIATRSDPSFRLQRLRVAGTMREIRVADLDFTIAEAGALLQGLELAPAEVELLWRRTEGWATGLRLAQLSLEGHHNPARFINGFAGGDAAVSGYLISEVVSRQPPEALDLLLRTCVADRLCGDLAEALTGSPNATHLLRELAGRDAFLTSVDHGAGWYRYHPLFADVLRAELHRRLPGETQGLHRRAGRWHAQFGEPLEALRHAIAAEDWVLAAEVLGEHWLVFMVRGNGPVLHRLAREIPEEAVRSDAELALALAGLLLERGDHGAADDLLVCAYELESRLSPRRRRRFAVTSTATSLYRARLRGEVDEALSAAQLVLDEHWDESVAREVRALTLANLGIAEFWAGRLTSAGRHLQQAAGLAVECGNDFVLFLAETYASAADARDGRLRDAEARAHTAIQLAERRGWTLQSHAALAYATLGTVRLWFNEPDEAQRFAEQAAATLEHSSEPLLWPAVAQLRARLLLLEGETLAALDTIRAAAANGPLPLFLRVSTGLLEGELWLRLGEPARARERLAEVRGYDAPDGAIGLARLELACGRPEAAIEAVTAFHADERTPVLPFARVEAWVIDSIARDATGDHDGALDALERALDLAEPRGFSNVIARYGQPVRSLMRRLIARGTAHRALAGDLVAALEHPRGSKGRATPALLEPLSGRELSVLRFLPTMMSNAEIAAEMFVSVNTVKTHLKHVYRKLDVTDRRDCVKRARELRLLSPGLRER